MDGEEAMTIPCPENMKQETSYLTPELRIRSLNSRKASFIIKNVGNKLYAIRQQGRAHQEFYVSTTVQSLTVSLSKGQL